MKDKIIDLIQKYHLSTSDVADALGKKGHMPEIMAVNRGFWVVGEIYYLFSWFGTIWITHKELAEAPQGKLLLVDNLFSGNLSVMGHLMVEYAMTAKKSLGIVVNGNIRDVDKMKNYPIWCKGFNPIVCDRKEVAVSMNDAEKNRAKFNGGVMVCDDTGVVVIESNRINQDTYQKLQTIAEREADWYAKLAKGMSTFEICC